MFGFAVAVNVAVVAADTQMQPTAAAGTVNHFVG